MRAPFLHHICLFETPNSCRKPGKSPIYLYLILVVMISSLKTFLMCYCCCCCWCKQKCLKDGIHALTNWFWYLQEILPCSIQEFSWCQHLYFGFLWVHRRLPASSNRRRSVCRRFFLWRSTICCHLWELFHWVPMDHSGKGQGWGWCLVGRGDEQPCSKGNGRRALRRRGRTGNRVVNWCCLLPWSW